MALFLAILAWTGGIAASGNDSTPSARPQFPIVQGEAYLGAIVPAERVAEGAAPLGVRPTSYWTPDATVIAELEAKLRSALEVGLHSPETLVPELKPGRELDYVTKQIAHVLRDLAISRRQYIGLVMQSVTKRVLVNAFPGASKVRDDFQDWRQRIVWAFDGGASYWRIQYIPSEARFTAFNSNGGA